MSFGAVSNINSHGPFTDAGDVPVSIVDGNGDQITAFGAGTQYTEDAAAAANPVGTAVNLIRADTPAGVVTTDGDNVAQRGTNFGAAYVTLLDAAGSPVTIGAGGTSAADDADFTAGTTLGTPAMGVYESSPTSVTDGDLGTIGITVDRRVKTSAVGNIAHDAANSGNPVLVGVQAETALPTAVADNDRAQVIGDTTGRPFVRSGHQGPAGNYWDAQHVPAANAQATITKTAAGSGIRNVCVGFTVTLAATSAAPAAVQITVAVIDGASGGTTYLWRSVISLPATAGAITSFVRSGIWLTGTANTDLTVEFSAAGGANTIESVTMEGTTVAE